MKKGRRWVPAVLAAVLLLTGCGEIHFGSIFPGSARSSKVLMSIGRSELSVQEADVWLWAFRTAFEKDYGEDLWNVNLEEETAAGEIRTATAVYLQHLFYASQLALEEGVEVSGEDQARIDQAASQYLEELPEDVSAGRGLKENVTEAYTHLFLARTSYSNAMSASNVEIEEEDARVVKVCRMSLPFSDDEEKASQKKKAEEIAETLSQLEENHRTERFRVLAMENGSESEWEMNVCREDLDQESEEAVYALAEGEMTEPLESEGEYILYYCENENVEEETAAHREERKEEKLKSVYQSGLESYEETEKMVWNASAWEKISVSDAKNYSADFFGIYDEFLS